MIFYNKLGNGNPIYTYCYGLCKNFIPNFGFVETIL